MLKTFRLQSFHQLLYFQCMFFHSDNVLWEFNQIKISWNVTNKIKRQKLNKTVVRPSERNVQNSHCKTSVSVSATMSEHTWLIINTYIQYTQYRNLKNTQVWLECSPNSVTFLVFSWTSLHLRQMDSNFTLLMSQIYHFEGFR